MDRENKDELIQEALEDIPNRFIITEEELDIATHKEYGKYIRNIDVRQYTEDDFAKETEKLFDSTVSIPLKKKIMARLAQTGTVKAYRTLERYAKHPEEKLKDWSRVALYECRMLLESSLLDKNVGIISTGLGGKGNRLRYIVVIGFSNAVLNNEQKQVIAESFQRICRRHDSEIEEIDFNNIYVTITLLVSMEVAVGIVIEKSINASNERIECLRNSYLVTNVKEPTEGEINSYLKNLR